MTWTYGARPADSATDAIRLLIGDTDEADPQLQDEELAYYLSEYPKLYQAAAEACRGIAARYARQVSKTTGRISVQAQDRHKHYLELAAEMEKKAAVRGGGARMFVGGRSHAGKRAFKEDSDAVQPAFRVGMNDAPGTSDADDYDPRLGRR
jgi:hypothetical protein